MSTSFIYNPHRARKSVNTVLYLHMINKIHQKCYLKSKMLRIKLLEYIDDCVFTHWLLVESFNKFILRYI